MGATSGEHGRTATATDGKCSQVEGVAWPQANALDLL